MRVHWTSYVQFNTSWVSEAERDPDEPSSDLSSSSPDDEDQEQMLDTDTALAAVAILDTQDSKLTHTEEAPLGQEDREIAANEGSCSTELSQGCSNKTEDASNGMGAVVTLEETAITHVHSLSDGGVGTESRQVTGPEKLASTPDLLKMANK